MQSFKRQQQLVIEAGTSYAAAIVASAAVVAVAVCPSVRLITEICCSSYCAAFAVDNVWQSCIMHGSNMQQQQQQQHLRPNCTWASAIGRRITQITSNNSNNSN